MCVLLLLLLLLLLFLIHPFNGRRGERRKKWKEKLKRMYYDASSSNMRWCNGCNSLFIRFSFYYIKIRTNEWMKCWMCVLCIWGGHRLDAIGVSGWDLFYGLFPNFIDIHIFISLEQIQLNLEIYQITWTNICLKFHKIHFVALGILECHIVSVCFNTSIRMRFGHIPKWYEVLSIFSWKNTQFS